MFYEDELDRPPAPETVLLATPHGVAIARWVKPTSRLSRRTGSGRDRMRPILHPALLGNARGLYEKALRQDRTFAEAHLRLGRVLMQLGHREEAQQELRACLQSAQNAVLSYLAQLLLGSTFEERGDYRVAEQWYKAASETVQDDLSARLGLARVLDATGRRDLAARSISEFLEHRPRDGRPSGLWWRYELGQLADLAGALRELRASARAS
jgi:tetratricopeptide (TPR) repeat protein